VGTEIYLLILFGLLIIGILAGFPVAFVMLGGGLIVGVMGQGMAFFYTLLLRTYGLMELYELIAIPLFVFMGVMLSESGVAERLFSAIHYVLGGLRGGLAFTTIVICTIMAAATGIVGASVVSMGLIALPAMINRNYDKAMSCGVISAGGTLGILIPPSIMLVVYGGMAGISVGRLFMGALLPGLLLSGLYITYVLIRCHLKPEDGPPMGKDERSIGFKKKLWLVVTSLLPTMFVILSVIGSIFFGIATATASAASGALASILLALGYGRLNFRVMHQALLSSLKLSVMIMWTVLGAFVFTAAFVAANGDMYVQELFLSLPLGPMGLIAIMGLAFLILGFLMEWVGIVPILVPIFSPVLLKLGIDPLWVGILFCMVMQTSFLTPPMAPALFFLRGVAPPEIKFGEHIIKGAIPFLILQVIGCFIVLIFPKIATWLPNMMYR
jgi:tripartite ATP-independent transporter DctM subunit